MQETSTAGKQSPNRRRWLRFSLRAFLLFVAVLSVWLAVKVNDAHRRQAALAAIKEAGGAIIHRETWSTRISQRGAVGGESAKGAPRWLRNLFGNEYFIDVAVVDLDSGYGHVDDAVLPKVAWLRTLEILILDSPNITDAGIAHVSELSRLRELVLVRTQVTDDGLARLARVPGLASLKIYESAGITDSGLSHLKRFPDLEHVTLADTSATDAGIEQLKASLPRLEVHVHNNRLYH